MSPKAEDGVSLTDANGAALSADNLPWADFDWRGRTFECNALFGMKNARNEKLVVQIAGSGDITVNSSITGLPTVSYANVNATAGVNPTATLSGSDTKVTLSPCSTLSETPTPTPLAEATPEDPPCSLAASPVEITSLKRKGADTAALAVTVNQPGTIDKTVNSNLTATTASAETVTASSGATISYTVKSANNSTGKFPIQFTYSNCSPVTVYVTVVK